MVANDPHNRKLPMVLGLIIMFTGFLLALIFTRVLKGNASDRQDLLQGAPFLISSDIDNTIYSYRVGSNVIMPMRIGFGYISPNVNDNNNAAVTFLDEFTIDYTVTDSWADKQSVYRKGFAYDNFGIVEGTLFAPNTGGITEWTTETFHVSKNQYVGVISAPPCPYYRMQDGYYQIYFRDVNIELSGADFGRGHYWCVCVPQEHYNEFVLTTDSFVYPYLDYWAYYYDFTFDRWIGLLPRERFHELLEGYTLAYADRSIKISCNDSSVYVYASQFEINIPTNSPTPSPTESPSGPAPGEGFDYRYRWDNAYDYLSENYPDYEILLIYGSAVSDPYPMKAFMVPDSDYDATSIQRISDGYFSPHYPEYWCAQSSLYEIDFVYDRDLESVTSVNSGPSSRSTSFNVTGSPSSYTFYGYNVAYKPAYYTGSLWTSTFEGRLLPLWNYGSIPEVTPTPSPTNTPTPTITPTPPPFVVIITPDPSPTPTPPFVIPTMPPWNPPGDQIIPLNPDIQDDVFGDFKARLGDNNAFGLIGLLIGLLPGDLMWYLWFLLFVLLVVGVAKLFIHFTGG